MGRNLKITWNLLGKGEFDEDDRGEQTRSLRLKRSTRCSISVTMWRPARYWSPHYIQHSNHIEPGREGLFKLIKSLPSTPKYEAGVIVAGGDFVMVHGRFWLWRACEPDRR